MIEISDKSLCCGCTACASVCKYSCIIMKEDEEGFLYPYVKKADCINCGECVRVCPLKNIKVTDSFPLFGYVVRTKNVQELMESTSGGFFTPLAKYVRKHNGVVCAASFDDDFQVVHLITYGKDEELQQYRGSKYVQSKLINVFSQLKNYLLEGKTVCFVGTPCQVMGLKTFLGKEYENLISVDVVCHGISSPKLWDKYLKYQINRYCASIQAISFRNKTYGYHSSTMRIDFDNGKTYFGSARVDPMLKAFFKDASLRPSCYSCKFKTIRHNSDFTIFDCWHFEELVPDMKDDDCGYTTVIIQSEKGAEIFNQIKEEYNFYPIDIRKAVDLDGIMMEHSADMHPVRSIFYEQLDESEIDVHIQKLLPITGWDYFLEWTKKGLYKSGMLSFVKKLKK